MPDVLNESVPPGSESPLPLTAFEEYMLMDSHPAYPMSCFIVLRLRGMFDAARFAQALERTLPLHPFFGACVREVKTGEFSWQKCDRPPEIVCVPEMPGQGVPHSTGIDLFHEPGLRIFLSGSDSPGDTDFSLTFEVHHSASDAGGAYRFIEDLLLEYASLGGFIEPDAQREAVKPELLPRRGYYGLTPWKFLRILHRQLWGLTRAWMFLLNRVLPLVPEKSDLSGTQPPADYPAILSRELDMEQTQAVREYAKQAGVTINDLLLNAAFQAMAQWRAEQRIPRRRGYLRIAVPTNLRNPEDRLMPAANLVSMVFLDRKPGKIADDQRFLQTLHREMAHIKRCNLGLAFIHGLNVYRRFFGSYKKMINQNRCWTTTTVSNLGSLLTSAPLPRRDGRLLLDHDLELSSVESTPPVRPQTSTGICAMTYAGRMTVSMQYDTTLLGREQAESLFEKILIHIRRQV